MKPGRRIAQQRATARQNLSWECLWTTFLAHGQITVEGPFFDAHNSVLAITGGTGAYRSARGEMSLNSRSAGTKFDFIFHLVS